MRDKVLFIVVRLDVGGVEMYLLRFLTYYENKFKSIILCKSGKEGVLIDDYKKIGCKTELRFVGFFSIKSWFNLYQYIKKEQFDSVCDFTGDFAGIPLLIAKLAGVKNRIVFYRESKYQFKSSFLKNAYAKVANFLVKKLATKILSNSIAAFKVFHPDRNVNDERFQVIYNGINFGKIGNKEGDLRKKYNIPKEAFIIGHVGRFTLAKNHLAIIEVANVLCKKYDDVYFYLCGKGVKEGVKEKIEEYDLQNKIIALGVCKNIPEHLRIMNLFLFPSFNEGQPNALLEALISGVPVVASNILPILESVPDELKPMLIDANDIPSFINSIENIKNGDTFYNIEKVQSWAKKEYDPKVRFNEFYQALSPK